MQCTDDSNYVGDYKKGKRHGFGVYSFPNGDQYLGEYEDDIPQVILFRLHLLEFTRAACLRRTGPDSSHPQLQ